MKIPLAWLQLSHEKIRLLVALAGIGFADLLMFMQLGFRDALLDSAVRFHKTLQGDIFVISTQTASIAQLVKSFSERRLYQALAVEGVADASPLYVGISLFKNPVKGNTRTIFIAGSNPEHNLINIPGVPENKDKIKLQDFVLFDSKSRKEFGPVVELFNQGKIVKTEVQGRRVTIGGLFSLGTSFAADGNLITSDINFLRIFPLRKKGLIDVGVIKIKPGANVNTIVASLKQELPDDVLIFSKRDFLIYERSYWLNRTAIGFVFTLGTIMGFIVGTVIVYQILYTDVADHLPEYATMKAMGYTNLYLLTVVFQQALILALVGYLPGLAVSNVLYGFTAKATGLPIALTLYRAVRVLILTIIMCCVSGTIAVRKLSAADPADIF